MPVLGRWSWLLVLGAGLAAGVGAEAACVVDADCGEARMCVRPVGRCGGAGACDDRLALCPNVFAPACGCDGRSYVNECAARHDGGGTVHAGACCVGACTALDRVGVSDLMIGVRQGLGMLALAACASFDRDQSARVTIDEIIAAVGNALHGCR